MGVFPLINLGCLSQIKFRFSSNFTAKSSHIICKFLYEGHGANRDPLLTYVAFTIFLFLESLSLSSGVLKISV